MKSLLLFLVICFGISKLNTTDRNIINNSVIPIANAGPAQTIYLTQTSTATLDGTLSIGDSFQWTDISTDQTNPAVITSPTSLTTTATGLIQGTWYYQLMVTNGDLVAKDTVIVRVDYDVPPENSVLLRFLPIAAIAPIANIRDDTTTYWGPIDPCPPCKRTIYTGDGNNYVILLRQNEQGMHVDSAKGKFYSTVKDGDNKEMGKYGSYARSELGFGSYYTLDSNITYCFEWKGYYPQSIKNNMRDIMDGQQFGKILTIMQWHNKGGDPFSPPFQLQATQNYIIFNEYSGGGNGADADIQLLPTTDSVIMRTHTYRVTIREGLGYPGQKAFIKVEVDGIQKYFRNTGTVGGTIGYDYPKFGSIYDWAHAIVSPDSLTRGKRFSLVTEAYRIYAIAGT